MKNKEFLDRFKHIPIGCTGLGVGLGGLGSLYTALIQFASPKIDLAIASIIQYVCISFTILFICLISFRNLAHKGTFKNEINHPLLSSFLPTIFMSLMLVGGFFGHLANIVKTKNPIGADALYGIGTIIWYIAIIGHLTIFALFLINIVRKHKIKEDHLYASWFVPPVGIIVSCTVATSLNNGWIPNLLFQIIWYFGFSLYVVLLPLIAYKLIFYRCQDKNTFPSIAIFGAPANLSLVGFLSVFTKKDNGVFIPSQPYYSMHFINTMVIMLLFLSIATTLIIYLLLPRIFTVKFNPSYASLTFPMAIGATATFKASLFLEANYQTSYMKEMIWIVRIISYIELAVATIIILYVLARYLIIIGQKIFEKKTQKAIN